MLRSLAEVSVDDVFVANVVKCFPQAMIGKLAMVSKVYLNECKEKTRKDGGRLRISISSLSTPDEVAWAIHTLESMRMADVPPLYDKTNFINSLAYGGSIVGLQSAVSLGCVWDDHASANAAERGHLEALEWMVENGCPLNHFQSLWQAAGAGRLDVMEWIVCTETFEDDDMETVAYKAAQGNHVFILDWIEENFPETLEDKSDFEIAVNAAYGYSIDALVWLYERGFDMSAVCDFVSGTGMVEVLRWAYNKKLPWSEFTSGSIAETGDLETLKWAVEAGCPMGSSVIVDAVKSGHKHIVTWAIANGCSWRPEACAEAAKRGDLELLQWLRSQGCVWDGQTCSEAARRGDLKMLMWARENNCPWGEFTFRAAEECGDLKLMRWARANGCPWM